MTTIDYSIYRSFFFHNVYYEIQKWFEKHEDRTSNDAVLCSLNKLMCDLDPKKWQVTYIKHEFANQIVYVLKLLETPIKELDINLWRALEKCIKYYVDLCKEEEEEIERRKNMPQSDIGFDMMPESEEESKTEVKSDVDGDETEEVHFVHHHTKPLVLFDETEIIDENECEKEGLEKFEYEELPSRDEDEDDDSDEDECNKKEEDPDETITITTSITRKRMRNVDYDEKDDDEKHEKPKKRLRCVCMFPRIIKYYF